MQLNACLRLCFVCVFVPIVFVSVILLFSSLSFHGDSLNISCYYCESVNFKSAYQLLLLMIKLSFVNINM